MITTEQIQATDNFAKLNKIQQSFAIKRSNRELLTNGFLVHKNCGIVCGSIQGYNIGILNDLIAKSK